MKINNNFTLKEELKILKLTREFQLNENWFTNLFKKTPEFEKDSKFYIATKGLDQIIKQLDEISADINDMENSINEDEKQLVTIKNKIIDNSKPTVNDIKSQLSKVLANKFYQKKLNEAKIDKLVLVNLSYFALFDAMNIVAYRWQKNNNLSSQANDLFQNISDLMQNVINKIGFLNGQIDMVSEKIGDKERKLKGHENDKILKEIYDEIKTKGFKINIDIDSSISGVEPSIGKTLVYPIILSAIVGKEIKKPSDAQKEKDEYKNKDEPLYDLEIGDKFYAPLTIINKKIVDKGFVKHKGEQYKINKAGVIIQFWFEGDKDTRINFTQGKKVKIKNVLNQELIVKDKKGFD